MSYTKTTWVNGGAPAIDADHLNNIEDGIYNNDQKIQNIETTGVFKDGSGNVSIPGNLTTAGNSGPVGEYYSDTGSESLANSTSYTVITDPSITLAPGRWIVMGRATFPGNATGVRGLALDVGGSINSDSTVSMSAVSNSAYTTRLQTMAIIALSSTTTIHLSAFQNSGGALNVDGALRAIRIR